MADKSMVVRETVKMPEGCFWREENGEYSVYITYPLFICEHDDFGDRISLIGQTDDLSLVTGIARRGRERDIALG